MSENIDLFDNNHQSSDHELGTLGRPGSLLESINRSMEYTQNHEPRYQPGETKSTNHLIFEMNEFYLEMVQKINELSLQRYDNYGDDDEDVEDTDSVLYEVVSAIRKKRNDPEMRKQIETVLKLDQMMENSFKTLKKEQMERLKVQNELCEIIDREDETYARSGCFRRLCDLESGRINSSYHENDSNIPTEVQEEMEETEENAARAPRNVPIKGANFIKRNKQLAKNTPTMSNSTYSLTDAEKSRLETLLIDIDKESEEPRINSASADDINQTNVYPYCFNPQDQLRLRELDEKLSKLSQVTHKSPKRSESSSATGKTTKSKPKTTETKWNEKASKQRLKQIDQQLQKLQSQRESFHYQPSTTDLPELGENLNKETNDNDTSDTINEVESIPFDSLHSRSQEILERIKIIVKQHSEASNVDNNLRDLRDIEIPQDDRNDYSDYENDEPVRD